MARLYNKPTKEQFLEELEEEHKETIYKMLEIQDILINNPPNDKKFNNNQSKYLIEYLKIINNIETDNKHYDDNYLKNRINILHSKIFKHRRY